MKAAFLAPRMANCQRRGKDPVKPHLLVSPSSPICVTHITAVLGAVLTPWWCVLQEAVAWCRPDRVPQPALQGPEWCWQQLEVSSGLAKALWCT